MKKILFIFGTRPEAIKLAPIIKRFQLDNTFETKVCNTAQHKEMLNQVLSFFKIVPDFDLEIMRPNQNLFTLTADIIIKLKPILEEFKPDYIFVHGDTTTTLSASLAGFYSHSIICHVEAGLRTNNKYSPFPEEINRQVTSRLADFHFAPTSQARLNLIKENIPETSIFVTGNSVIDALMQSIAEIDNNTSSVIDNLNVKLGTSDLLLVTGHRRENHGLGFINICMALKIIAETHPDLKIVYPVHLNPNVQKPVNQILSSVDNIILISPLDYQDFIWLMNRAKIILTDSGGIQEEAPSLGKPVLVMRETTERPEAVEAGTVILVGTNVNRIVCESNKLLTDVEYYNRMSCLHNPYGDGLTSERILNIIKQGN